jgi:hypothetical protein
MRIINLTCVLSAYRFNSTINSYEETDKENNTKNAFSESGYLSLEEHTTTGLALISTLSNAVGLLPDSALVVCMAIEFYQEAGGKMCLLQSGGVMKVAAVF